MPIAMIAPVADARRDRVRRRERRRFGTDISAFRSDRRLRAGTAPSTQPARHSELLRKSQSDGNLCHFNYPAILVAALISLRRSAALWYSPLLFAQASWMREAGLDDAAPEAKPSIGKVFALALPLLAW